MPTDARPHTPRAGMGMDRCRLMQVVCGLDGPRTAEPSCWSLSIATGRAWLSSGSERASDDSTVHVAWDLVPTWALAPPNYKSSAEPHSHMTTYEDYAGLLLAFSVLPLSTSTSSREAFQLVRSQLTKCCSSHRCYDAQYPPQFPSCVLDLRGGSASEIRFRVTGKERAHSIRLGHC